MTRNELVLKHRTMVIKEELFTCIHVCLHVIQHKWIKHINNDFPCIPFLQISHHSNDFFHEAMRRQKILLPILIVSTNKVNVFKIRALPVFGWFNECIIVIFFILIRFKYSSTWFNTRSQCSNKYGFRRYMYIPYAYG